jgi:hypothetical protein
LKFGFTRKFFVRSCILGGSGEFTFKVFCQGSGGSLPRHCPEIVSLTHSIFSIMNKTLLLAAVIAAAALAACGKKEEAAAPAAAPAAAAPAADASAAPAAAPAASEASK